MDSIQFNFITPASMKIKEQRSDSVVLELQYLNVPDAGKVNTAYDHTVDVMVEKIDGGWHIFADPKWSRHVSIYLKDLGEHFFGIRENLVPDNQKSPDLRGSNQTFEIKGEGGGYYENFASAWSTLFFNNLGYASFFNTFARGEYQFAVNGRTIIYHHTGKLDWYVFTGNDGDEIMAAYYRIIGPPKYVPPWACGVTVWRDEDKNGKDDILNDAEQFTALKIPITSIMVDRPYSDGNNGWSKMDFNAKFSDPGKWIGELNDNYNLQFMSWVATCTFGDTSIFRTLPGDHAYLDLTDPAIVSKFSDLLNENEYAFGVRGHKMDRGDEVFPAEINWHDNTPEWERRNRYPYLFAKVIDSILTAKWGKDNFNYARGALGGSQKYLSALWGGDVRASWDGMACNLANAIRCGFMGFPDWGSDVGGYLGAPGMEPENSFSRWLQWGAWCGLFEIKLDGVGAQGEDRAPWHYGKSLQDKFRESCEERMSLAPYIYSQLNISRDNGVLMKPLTYEYRDDPKTYNIWDEYCFGNSFLVAPVVKDEISRVVYLPAGAWYDWYSPTRLYLGGKKYEVNLSADHIPVFVRENAIFVTGSNWLRGNSVRWDSTSKPELIVNAFPGKGDFGNRFVYVDRFNNDSLKEITITQKERRLTLDIPVLGCNGRVVLYNVRPERVVTLDGKIAKVSVDREKRTVTIPFNGSAAHAIILK